MKAIRMDSNYAFYVKVLFTIFLIASLAFLQAPYVIADQGHHDPIQASLSVVKKVESHVSAVRIQKSVDSREITLSPGGSPGVVTYTINVTREYMMHGTVTATNGIENKNPALVTSVVDELWYRHSGHDEDDQDEGEGKGWHLLKRATIHGEDSISPGESQGYDFDIEFAAPEGVHQFRNVAKVYISNRGGQHPDEPYMGRDSFDLEQDTSAVSVEDVESLNPDNVGISYKVTSVTLNGTPSLDLVGPWSVTPPATIIIQKEITAAATATPGRYLDALHNVARIVPDGPSDSKDVTVEVLNPQTPGDGGQPSDGGQPTSTGGGGGGGGAVEQAATVTTEAAPAPEQVAVLPAVVSQPAPAPEVVAQAKPAAIPKKLPFTGVNSWYITLAVLLIMAGSLLQFFRSPQPRYSKKR